MNHLDAIRRNFGRCLIPALWAHVPAVAAAEALLGGGLPPLAPVVAAAILAGTVTLLWLSDPVGPATQIVSGLALIGVAASLLTVFTGHRWQIDLHMYFFACLAVLVGWCDRRVILAATAAIAMHHLTLDVAMPVPRWPS